MVSLARTSFPPIQNSLMASNALVSDEMTFCAVSLWRGLIGCCFGSCAGTGFSSVFSSTGAGFSSAASRAFLERVSEYFFIKFEERERERKNKI